MAAENPSYPRLHVRTDNGNRHIGNDFGRSAQSFGTDRHEFIRKNAPEQNRHVELFHNPKADMYGRRVRIPHNAEAALADVFAGFNNRRIHSTMDTWYR